ncbi:TPA: SCO family protein, partial [Neisseria gonorrhoeae]
MFSVPRSFLPGVFVLAALAACKPQDNSAAQAASSSASA